MAAPCSGEATDASTNFWEVVAQFGYFSIVTSAPPGPGADVAAGEPSLGAYVARASPVPW